LPAGSSRIAVADVYGDKLPRLLVLDSDHTLSIYEVSTGKLKAGDSLDLGPKAKEFVAGQFAAGQPAVIVSPGAVFYQGRGGFVKTPVKLDDITGTVRFADGAEFFFLMDG